MYVRFPLSLRQVEDLLHERGIDISYETVRAWWNRFGPLSAAEIRKNRSAAMRKLPQWRWHLDEVIVRINGETHYLWRAVDHEGEVLEAFVTKKRDRKAAMRFLKKAMKRYGNPLEVVTDRLRSYRAAMRVIGNVARQTTGALAQQPEPVNDFETLTFAIYCTRSPVVGLGGLIQTASGSGLGSGHPRTKRSGCAAHAVSKMRRRCSIIACARPW